MASHKNAKALFSLPYRIWHVRSVSSTNKLLSSLAKEGEQEGLVLWADKQSAGHGRFDRAFHSPRGSGVYMSILLRPAFAANALPLLSALTAVAAAEAAEELSGKRIGIKWVNDLYLDGHKIAGILAESGFSKNANSSLQNDLFVVIGIGINLYTPPRMPKALQGVAGGLWQTKREMRAACGKKAREAFITTFLSRFDGYIKQMPEAPFLEGYRERSVLVGRYVRIHNAAFDSAKEGAGERALVLSINERGALVVETEGGERKTLEAGEVTLSL